MNQRLGRERMLFAIRSYAEGQLERHRMNIEVYLENPSGIGEHPDLVQAVEAQVDKYVHALEMVEGCDKLWGIFRIENAKEK